MQCKELEAVLEQEGLTPLPREAREHLAGCVACQDLLADLSAIAVTAKRLPAEANPPDRIWVSLRAQLEAEGIIQDLEPVSTPVAAPWWQGFAEFFRVRTLATVGTALFLVAGSVYLAEHSNLHFFSPNAPQPRVTETAKTAAPAPSEQNSVASVEKAPPQSASAQVPATQASRPADPNMGLQPSPSENAYFGDSAAVLSQTEDALPSRELANNATVDASLRQNLRTLNEFIAECEARLKQNPQDQLTREYLNMAYQQKAELLAAMMDSGRSEQ